MSRPQPTPGQIAYEACAMTDRSACHWPEWRALSPEEQHFFDLAWGVPQDDAEDDRPPGRA